MSNVIVGGVAGIEAFLLEPSDSDGEEEHLRKETDRHDGH